MDRLKVKSIAREYASKFIGAPEPVLVATVVADNGDWLGLSQYADEDYWQVDCYFKANGYPVFAHGTGSRLGGGKAVTSDHPFWGELEAAKKKFLEGEAT